MKKAFYNPGYGLPLMELFVLAENADGTLELGTDEKTLKVGKCMVTLDGAIGTCTCDGTKAAKLAQDAKDKVDAESAKAAKLEQDAKDKADKKQ